MPGLVTVFGGSGFLGRAVVVRLATHGLKVRIAVRHPDKTAGSAQQDSGAALQAIEADIRDDAAVAAAVDGAQAIVNAVGLYRESGAETFAAIHVQGAARVARHAAQAGVEHLIHISGIGADRSSASPYVRARAEGEQAVTAAFESATILRPSVLFGPGDSFINSLAAIVRVSPLLPLFGRGETRLQPVYLHDVAEAVARVAATPAAQGRLYELGGPDIHSYREIIELLLRHMARRRVLLPLPFVVWDLVAWLSAALPRPPITRDQLALIRRDNLVSPGVGTFADLGIQPTALADVLSDCLSSGEGQNHLDRRKPPTP